MQYEAYYLVGPRRELLELLPRLGGFGEFATAPFLWINRQGGRTTLTKDDCTLAIKQLFLLRVRHYARNEGNDFFDEIEISADEFDRWWTLDVHHGADEHAAEVLAELREADQLSDLPPEQVEWLDSGVIR